MRTKLRNFVISTLSCLTITACNNDIFVEDTSPSVNEVKLDGDGGTAIITYKPNGIKGIYIGSTDNYNTYTYYYDKNGDILGDGSFSFDNIGSITYQSMWSWIDIDINGDKLTIRSIENSSADEQEIYISLDYGHISESISLIVFPGEPIKMTFLVFVDNNINITPISKIESHAQTFRNNSPTHQQIEFRPYAGREGVALLDPENFWANNLEVETSLPTYLNGKWTLDDNEIHRMILGQRLCYVPKGMDQDITVKVEVPPYTTVKAVCGVEYSSITLPFFVNFINPVSGREFTEIGVCTVSEPVEYRIHTEYEQQ